MSIHARFSRRLIALAVPALLGAAACSSSNSTDSDQANAEEGLASGHASASPSVVRGVVQSGTGKDDETLRGMKVRLYEAHDDCAPTLLGTTTSGRNGHFSLPFRGRPDGVLYVTATRRDGLELAAVLGESIPAFVTVNELTTVAQAYAFAQLTHGGDEIEGSRLALRIAAGMSANLVDVKQGRPSERLRSSPNADQTNSLRGTRSLANLLAACVDDPETNIPILFALATPPGGEPPKNTLRALVNVARHPGNQVQGIYDQSKMVERFQPALQVKPDAWTLAVKVNDTGSSKMPWGGSANTVFDENGYAWINNNTVQGTTGSSMNIVVLKPDGSPADGFGHTPKSPVTGGGLLGPGFGIARDRRDGNIWVGNFGWGGVNPGPPPNGNGNGSVSRFSSNGRPISGKRGYDGGTDRVQGLIVDPDGNIWTANFGSNKLVVFLKGDPHDSAEAPLACRPFGLAFADDGTVWASTVGSFLDEPNPCSDGSTVTHWKLHGRRLEQLSSTQVGNQLKGLDVDRRGMVWVASGGDDTVYRLDPKGDVIGAFQGGGIDSPWAVRIDDGGDVWVANFGPMAGPPNNVYLDSAVSVLAGPGSRSRLPVGTPISPSTGYTLRSAGEPVLLSDGTPLSETGFNQPGFTPMMRLVSVVPDRAGNVWATNNWKPNFTTDLVENPGGDGIVIFVGLAAPTEPGRTQ